jgi:hypothetical protein
MKLIYGEHDSGKSTKALSLIKDKKRVFYLSLDQDKSICEIFSKGFKDAEFRVIKDCFLIDIEFALIGTKPLYNTLVIDSLNFIKLVEDVNYEANLKRIIKGLEYLHYTYDVEIIATYNTLRNVDSIKPTIKRLFDKDWELIETTKKKSPKKWSEKEKTGVVPESFW